MEARLHASAILENKALSRMTVASEPGPPQWQFCGDAPIPNLRESSGNDHDRFLTKGSLSGGAPFNLNKDLGPKMDELDRKLDLLVLQSSTVLDALGSLQQNFLVKESMTPYRNQHSSKPGGSELNVNEQTKVQLESFYGGADHQGTKAQHFDDSYNPKNGATHQDDQEQDYTHAVNAKPEGGSTNPCRLIWNCLSAPHFEPKFLDLQKMCTATYPGKKWKDLDPKSQVAIIRQGLKADSFLLDPNNNYLKYWDLIIVFALVFTGLVTPYEVILLKTVSPGFFVFGRIIDMIFVKDMIMYFFLKVEQKKSGTKGTTYIKDPWKIRKRYLTSWFLIDLVSIMPFDILLLIYEDADMATSVQQTKILRCVRLLRLVKLLRILRGSRLILRWQNYFAVSFATQKIGKISTVALLSAHWMSLLWAFVGLSLGKELCDRHGNNLELDEEILVSEVSWVTTLFTGGKFSPDNVCSSFDVYVAALHWSVMTITSIGYGDIVPVRNEEYIVGIACMLAGGVMWAYVIGSVSSIILNVHPVDATFEANTDLLNLMLKEASVPKADHQHYREYLREAKIHESRKMFYEVSQSFSPLLRGSLLMHVSQDSIRQTFYFASAPSHILVYICENLGVSFFSRQEPMTSVRYQLGIVDSGAVIYGSNVLVAGQVFQEDFLLANRTFQSVKPTKSLLYSQVLTFTRDNLITIVSTDSKFSAALRKVAARMAMRRVLLMSASIAREHMRATGSSYLSLPAAFSYLIDPATKHIFS